MNYIALEEAVRERTKEQRKTIEELREELESLQAEAKSGHYECPNKCNNGLRCIKCDEFAEWVPSPEEAEVERYRKALEFYADSHSWDEDAFTYWTPAIEDSGQIAIAALKE